MTRRRYRYNEATKELEEIALDVPLTPRLEIQTGAHYADLRAVDGTPIDSPGKHRAYMKANNVTLASDFAKTWEEAPKKRAAEMAAGRREQVARVVHQLENGRRR